MAVEFGLSLPAGPPHGRINKWLDDLDTLLPQLEGHIKSVWMTDHFFWDDHPTYEAWTAISFLAARFTRFIVGPVVLGQSYRNPALTAKMAATLQVLSNGRLFMGIGAGWKEDEYRAYGYPFPSARVRVEQLEDTLEIMRRLWTVPGRVTYHGHHYSIVDAYLEPMPEPIPPILVGGGGRKTTLLAVRYADLWNMPDANFEQYRKRLSYIDQHCETVGRDPDTLRKGWFGRLVLGQTEDKAIQRGLPKYTRERAFVGTPAQVVEQMGPFIEAGCDHFIVEILDLETPDVMAMFLEQVLPHVQPTT